jgi:hypothetical protein
VQPAKPFCNWGICCKLYRCMFFCSWNLRHSNWAGIHHCCLPACLCITIITSPHNPRNNTNFLQSKPDALNLVSIRQEDLGRRRSSEGRRL